MILLTFIPRKGLFVRRN